MDLVCYANAINMPENQYLAFNKSNQWVRHTVKAPLKRIRMHL